MSQPQCFSCRSRIDFQKNREGSFLPVNSGLVQAVAFPPKTVGKCFLMLVAATGLVERCREPKEDETNGILLGYVLHRSTCRAQGVPRS